MMSPQCLSGIKSVMLYLQGIPPEHARHFKVFGCINHWRGQTALLQKAICLQLFLHRSLVSHVRPI